MLQVIIVDFYDDKVQWIILKLKIDQTFFTHNEKVLSIT
jgi:hypothetical protein